jgi:serine phosphatase RsbU (regulator of sigma subunit)
MTGSLLDIGVAQCALDGEVACGDCCVVQQSGDRALIGVIDGLGHGAEAAFAAESARAALDGTADQSVSTLLMRCHDRLRQTRGAAMTIMGLDMGARRLEWAGAGNIAAVLLRPAQSGKLNRTELFVRGGVVGVSLPSGATSCVAVQPGDMVVAATDGVHSGFADDITRVESPQRLAERLLARHQTGHDDALVVVIRIRWSLA